MHSFNRGLRVHLIHHLADATDVNQALSLPCLLVSQFDGFQHFEFSLIELLLCHQAFWLPLYGVSRY